MKTEFQHTAGNAGIIGLATFGGALVGFVLQLLVAYYFGADTETDAYFMAINSSELLSKLLLGGSITSVFIPLFVSRLSKHKNQEAWNLALNVFHVTASLYIILIILLFLFSDQFVHFIAPGFKEEKFHLTVQLLRVLLPSFFFMFLVDMATAMLHSLKSFGLPAMLRLVAPTISIIVILISVDSVGIYALALGTVIGSFVQLSILLSGLWKKGFSYRFVFEPFHPDIKKLSYLVYPFIFSALATQVAGIVNRILVSELSTGSLSSLNFAVKINQLLTLMFLNSITLVVFPLLAEKVSKNDTKGIKATLKSASRLLFFVTMPLVVGVALLHTPIIQLAYGHGSFSAEDVTMTSSALLFYILGLTINGFSSLLGYAVLAYQKTKISVAVSIISQVVAVSLFFLLVPSMGHNGLALTSSIVPISTALLYYWYLSRRIPRLHQIFAHTVYLKTILLTLLLGITVFLLLQYTSSFTLNANLQSFVQVFIPTLFGSAVYFGGAYLWHIEEVHEVFAIVQGKVKKWRKA